MTTEAEALRVQYVGDWQQRLRGRLYQQFRDVLSWQQISDIIAAQAQPLEDTWQQLLTIVSIDASAGVQLQVLGQLVGQPYNGEDDATYRLRLRARIRANMSSGTSPDMYGVFLAMFGLQGTGWAQIITSPSSPASMVFVSNRPLGASETGVLFDLLVAAKVAGVRLVLQYPSGSDEGSFAFDPAGAGWGGLVYMGTAYPDYGGAFAGSLST